MLNFHDKKAANKFQDAIVKALETIAKEHGMTVRGAGGTIKSEIKADLKFEFTVDDADAKGAVEKRDFEQYCKLYNLEPSDYGAKFNANGKQYTLIGFNLSRPKFCIRVRDAEGKETFFGEAVVPYIVKQRAGA